MFFVLLILLNACFCDWNQPLAVTTCKIDQSFGTWILYETNLGYSKTNIFDACLPNTNVTDDIVEKTMIEMVYPNIVKDSSNGQTIGTFTSLSGSGFEIRINDKRYIMFFFYEIVGFMKIITYCNKTFTGWVTEDVTMNPKHWGCFYGTLVKKISPSTDSVVITERDEKEIEEIEKKMEEDEEYEPQPFIPTRKIVNEHSIETAREYRDFFKQYRDSNDRNDLPDNFDWRNHEGKNYVSPVKDQGNCGSCYIFATTGMLESRASIQSDLQDKPVLSEQDLLNCGYPVLFACGGGLDFVVEKYIGWFGAISESCVPYVGKKENCSAFSKNCTYRKYVDSYEYVGGYYGGTDEDNMMQEIFSNGPVTGEMLVEDAFEKYSGGVYTCQNHTYGEADHQILVIGWGVEDDGTTYWWVKNSWGNTWGPYGGFFKIRRGQNDCNIEVEASSAFLYLQ